MIILRIYLKVKELGKGLEELVFIQWLVLEVQKGDKGDGISIIGDYNSYEELINNHPSGNRGDCYLIGGNLYVWNSEKSIWDNVGNIEGPQGRVRRLVLEK